MRSARTCFTIVALSTFCGVAFLCAQQYQFPFQNPNLPVEERANKIVSLMTLDEKLAALGNPALQRLGIPNFGEAEGIHQALLRGGMPANLFAPGANPGGAPPAGGAPGGARGAGRGRVQQTIPTTSFAQVYGMGETWNPELIRRAGNAEAYEARYATQSEKYKRISLMLSGPTSDLARDPRWGRTDESYGEDPFLTGTMATAWAKGILGDDPKYWLAAPMLKHVFANSNETTRAFSSSDFDERSRSIRQSPGR